MNKTFDEAYSQVMETLTSIKESGWPDLVEIGYGDDPQNDWYITSPLHGGRYWTGKGWGDYSSRKKFKSKGVAARIVSRMKKDPEKYTIQELTERDYGEYVKIIAKVDNKDFDADMWYETGDEFWAYISKAYNNARVYKDPRDPKSIPIEIPMKELKKNFKIDKKAKLSPR